MTNSFVENDTASALQVTCKDKASGQPIDLTDCTVNLIWLDKDEAKVTKAMTVVDATAGIVKYTFRANELYTPSMNFEVEITNLGGDVLTNLDLIPVVVRPRLA